MGEKAAEDEESESDKSENDEDSEERENEANDEGVADEEENNEGSNAKQVKKDSTARKKKKKIVDRNHCAPPSPSTFSLSLSPSSSPLSFLLFIFAKICRILKACSVGCAQGLYHLHSQPLVRHYGGVPAREVPRSRLLCTLYFSLFAASLRPSLSGAAIRFAEYGEIKTCVLVRDRESGTPRGSAFIQFADPSSVDSVLQEAYALRCSRRYNIISMMLPCLMRCSYGEEVPDPSSRKDFTSLLSNVYVDGRPVVISKVRACSVPSAALSRPNRQSTATRRSASPVSRSSILPKQKSAVYTLPTSAVLLFFLFLSFSYYSFVNSRPSVPLKGTPEAEELPAEFVEKRLREHKKKLERLKNPNFSVRCRCGLSLALPRTFLLRSLMPRLQVSHTRLSVRNLPRTIDEKELRRVLLEAARAGTDAGRKGGEKPRLLRVKIERDPDRKDKSGKGRSKVRCRSSSPFLSQIVPYLALAE